jgi:A/G-specific adenine glycosylase
MATSTQTQALSTLLAPHATARFATQLIGWQRTHGRHHLPWKTTSPYHVWVSELMLQQTQVKTVLAYYTPFIEAFPTVFDLAQASRDDVYAKWSGLGYYRRANFLWEGAKMVVKKWDGAFPLTISELLELPGVGPSTAHAIAAFCANTRVSICDGNVFRTLSRWLADSATLTPNRQKEYFSLAQTLVPEQAADMPAFTQGLMDLGATVCTPKNPNCAQCPLQQDCQSFALGTPTAFPRKPIKRKSPTRHLLINWHEKGESIGFMQYDRAIGVWEHLFGPPIAFVQQESIPTDAPFVLKHVFSHFIGHFHLKQHSTEPSNHPSLIWRTRDEWLLSGVPTPIRTLLLNRQT